MQVQVYLQMMTMKVWMMVKQEVIMTTISK